jgi:hypothetical protein
MIEFFGAFFQDVFSLEIDDGSLGQTAKLICDLWRELGNADLQQSSDSSSTATIQHSSPTLNELYKRWSERAVAVPAAQILDQRRYIDDEDAVVDDDEMEVDKSQQQTECKSSTDQTASSFSKKKQENVVEVDEDGVEWTVVRKGRR